MSLKTSQETVLTAAGMTGAELIRLARSGNNYAITSDELAIYIAASAGVTSVSGTTNRITSTGGLTPVIDISASYVGQASITTLGTVTTGTWSASTIAVTRGGTGLTSIAQYKILYATAANTLAATTNVWYDGTTFVMGGVTTPLATAKAEVQGGFSIRQGLGTYSQVFIDSATGAGRGQFVLATTSSDFVYYKMTGLAGAEAAIESLRISNLYGSAKVSSSGQFHFIADVVGGFSANTYGSTTTTTATCAAFGTVSTADGGGVFAGYASNTGGSFPLLFDGYWTGTTPASGYANIVFRAFKNNGANVRTAIASAELASQWRNNSTVLMTIDGAGNVAIGTHTTISAKLHVISTTAQQRLGYDVSNYYTATVSSTGSMTLALTGTTPKFTFSNGIILPAGTTTVAPFQFTSGTNLTTAVAGGMEYNGTNLFFTRSGTTRENVLVAVDNASAPSTSVGVAIVNYYGSSATNFLGTPNRWISINILGTVYKVPLYT